jgi:hypothetical protein
MRGRGFCVVLLGALAVALIGSGCSSSSSGSSDTGLTESSITKAEYVKKAEAICKKGNEELEADFGSFVKEEGSVKPSEGVYDDLLEQVVAPNVTAEVEALRELEVPEGEASEIEAMLKAREGSIAIAEEEPKAIIQNTKKVFGEASTLAKEYGLEACATR